MSKKKITDPEGSMEELIARAVEAAKSPFTDDRDPSLPSLRSVAEQLGTTVIRTRKLLITAGYFSSPTAQSVQRLKAEGKTIKEIGAALRLKPAAVYGYLPYEFRPYNLPETTSNADRHKRYRATKKLKVAVDTGNAEKISAALWRCVIVFEGYTVTSEGAHHDHVTSPSGFHIDLHFILTEREERAKPLLDNVWNHSHLAEGKKHEYKKQNRILGILLTLLLCSLLLSASAEAPNTIVVPATITEIVDRTDLTAEDFLGTWELTKMQMEGFLIPATQLGFSAKIVIDENSIQLTDIFGSFNEYETTFEEGFLYYRKGNDRMKVSISMENLLYISIDVSEYYGTTEDEGSPVQKDGTLDLSKLEEGTLSEFYEKVEQ